MSKKTARKFLEDYDPQIKEMDSDNYLYSVEQVIERLEAFYLKFNGGGTKNEH